MENSVVVVGLGLSFLLSTSTEIIANRLVRETKLMLIWVSPSCSRPLPEPLPVGLSWKTKLLLSVCLALSYLDVNTDHHRTSKKRRDPDNMVKNHRFNFSMPLNGNALGHRGNYRRQSKLRK